MSSADLLHGFAYGEDVDGASGRTLGYRLLAPAAPAAWSAEVEALARSLQATPYPEPWPAVELFCSVLLATGLRVVAVVRYGLADHTASRRRGGLELVGVVGPGPLEPSAALRLYGWLRRGRAETDDLRQLGGQHTLGEILAEAPPDEGEAVPLLPVQAWREGVLLFAASSSQAPDRARGLLRQAAAGWQWLPLCGPDFPLDSYAQRGPLVAWVPEKVEMAVRLTPALPARARASSSSRRLAAGLAVLMLLLTANLWALWSLPSRLEVPTPAPPRQQVEQARVAPSATAGQEARDALALALYQMLRAEGATELAKDEARLLARYQRAAARDDGLRVADKKGQEAIGLVTILADRSADRVAGLIEAEFRNRKGYDPELIHLIAQRVRARLLTETDKGPP